jgi:hypothetical protein
MELSLHGCGLCDGRRREHDDEGGRRQYYASIPFISHLFLRKAAKKFITEIQGDAVNLNLSRRFYNTVMRQRSR